GRNRQAGLEREVDRRGPEEDAEQRAEDDRLHRELGDLLVRRDEGFEFGDRLGCRALFVVAHALLLGSWRTSVAAVTRPLGAAGSIQAAAAVRRMLPREAARSRHSRGNRGQAPVVT